MAVMGGRFWHTAGMAAGHYRRCNSRFHRPDHDQQQQRNGKQTLHDKRLYSLLVRAAGADGLKKDEKSRHRV
jgi:hypothetical protein